MRPGPSPTIAAVVAADTAAAVVEDAAVEIATDAAADVASAGKLLVGSRCVAAKPLACPVDHCELKRA